MSVKLSVVTSCASVLIAAASPVLAQTTSARPAPVSETVVVTATVAPAVSTSITRTVTLLTREQLEAFGLGSVVDAARFVPGVDPRARGPMGVQTDFSIRGGTFGEQLVLVDGLRINDTQSGHHNGEIPLPATAIDRLEVVAGAASAVHGADALGGTINVISRRGAYTAATVSAGEHGYAAAEFTASGGRIPQGWMLSGWGSRSAGFMTDRDFAQGGAVVRGQLASHWSVDVRHERRAFGANGFYGPSPSKEWTDQTVAALGWTGALGAWTATVDGLVRDHGDHFRWDVARPGFAENRHRTHAAEYRVVLSRMVGAHGATVSAGATAGGDWIESSNLGDHRYARTAGFAEVQFPMGVETTLVAGIRVDDYSTFGRATSPTAGVTHALSSSLRVRASAGHAFRLPSFTELYYSDPGNLGSPDLRPERGWSVDGGGDWTPGRWTSSLSVFRRWDRDVIDWVRASAVDRYQSTNVRDVTATGFEASLSRTWKAATLRLFYAGLTIDAPSLTLQSKYVLEYARHQSGGSIAIPLGHDLRLSLNVDHRHRLDGQSYELVQARVSRTVRRAEVFVEGTNLTNVTYHEVVGVAMPGRWVVAGVRLK